MGQIGYFFNIIFTFPIYNALLLLDQLFHDFGLSIIVLTLIIRLCLVPLTLKQLRSSKAMQAIQPLMADIRKKYANDQRAQYQAMQALYKEYNISPLAGCLPLLFQLPVLYGMYGAMRLVLSSNVSYVYPFLSFITAHPDVHLNWFTFINANWKISLALADPSHILPVLAALATFVQLRMSQARARTGQQKDMMTQQMQIMSYIMPFVTGWIAWSFPAGLALYWTTTSIFGMVQQYFVTGWGSLFSVPSLGGESKASSPDTRKEKPQFDKVVDSTAEALPEQNSRANGTKGYGNGSPTRRRRPNSASARRRGSTAPRRNPSRS